MHFSVRAKQLAGVTSLAAAIVVTLSVLHLTTLARVTLGENQARGELLANAIFHRAHEVVAGGGDPRAAIQADRAVAGILESGVYSPNVTYAAIADGAGLAIAHSDPEAVGRPMTAQTELRDLLDRGAWPQLAALYADAGIFEVRQPLLIDGQPFGSIRIGVSMLLARRDLARALEPAFVTALIALAISGAVALALARSLLRPVHLIRSGLSRLGRGEFGVTLDLPQRDEFGELGTFFNAVSAQVSADRSLLAGQKATLESLIERFEEAVALFGPGRTLVFANPGMLALLPPDPIGQPLASLFPADHPFRRLVDACVASGASQGPVSSVIPTGHEGEAGAERTMTAHAIANGHEPPDQIGVMLVARNLSDLTAVQSTIRLSERLTAMGRLTSGVAHELKNPLNAMGIHLELIRQHLQDGAANGGMVDVSATQEHVAVIAESLRRLDEVVQAFLKFTRPEELRLVPTAVSDVLEHVRPLVEAEARARAIDVDIVCAGTLPAIRADAAMLEQAFLNLALNACQAMPRGGHLRVVADTAPGRYVQVRFEDSGVGIVPEHLDKVFNLYFTTKEGGSGIGLSMVYRAVQLHDGEIEVQSSPGQGTTFRVLLPQA